MNAFEVLAQYSEAVAKKIEDADALGHEWSRHVNGSINFCAVDINNHNGPQCVKCDYWYCCHCDDGPEESCTGETRDWDD